MSNMVEVAIDSIRVSLMSQQRVIILRELNSERYLPIMVGVYEAEHLTLALQDVEVSRPLTYDLFVNILDTLDAQVVHVEIVALKDETYFGNIVISINGTLHDIDSRPSDAMNLAVRLQVPIPEDYLAETGVDEEVEPERLSVFENYLDKIAPDKPDPESSEEEKPDDE